MLKTIVAAVAVSASVSRTRSFAVLLIASFLATFGCQQSTNEPEPGRADSAGSQQVELSDEQVEDIVRRSYQYVAMYNVNNKFAMDPRNPLGTGGWNRVKANTTLADHTLKAIARPNNDTLYVNALLDLRQEPRPIRISGRRESGIAACPTLVEFDQLFIQMQILDHRTHLDVEPRSKHLVRPVLWPLLLIGQPTVQHRREQVWPEVVQNLPFRVGVPVFRQEVHMRRPSQVLEDLLGDISGVVSLGPCEVGWQRSDDDS